MRKRGTDYYVIFNMRCCYAYKSDYANRPMLLLYYVMNLSSASVQTAIFTSFVSLLTLSMNRRKPFETRMSRGKNTADPRGLEPPTSSSASSRTIQAVQRVQQNFQLARYNTFQMIQKIYVVSSWYCFFSGNIHHFLFG